MQMQSERRGSTPRSKILVEGKTHIFNLIALQNLVRSDRKFYIKLSRNKTPEQHGDIRPMPIRRAQPSNSKTTKNYQRMMLIIGPGDIRSGPFQFTGAIQFTPDPPKPQHKFIAILQNINEGKSTQVLANTIEYKTTQNGNFDGSIKIALKNELSRYSKQSMHTKSPLKAYNKELKSLSSLKKFNLNYSKTSNNDSQSRVLIRYSSNIPLHSTNRLSHTRPERSSYRADSHKNSSINSTKKHESSIINDAVSINRDTLIDTIKDHIKMLNEIPPTSLEYYSQISLIYKGNYGTVLLALHKLTGKKVSIKCIDKNCMKDQTTRMRILQEISILKRVQHSNIIGLYEVFETSKQMMIVMEYAKNGDLFQIIKKQGKLDENTAKIYLKQLLYGLAYIHSRYILHRDIKPNNILVDAKGNIKISDFGNSKIMKKNLTVNEQSGTLEYMSPEIALNKVILYLGL